MVVDDDEDMLIIMQQKLIREGYDPIFSPNGKNAMAIITQRRPDLVLLDIAMDGLSGSDLCKEIKDNSATASIPVVMYSANDDIEKIMRECGADAFLRKPFAGARLNNLFHHLLAG